MTRAIVLVGLPGAGKTTVGRALAARLGRDFVDVDAFIEAETGNTITQIFSQDGEAAFRRLEAEAIGKLVGRGGVLAPGGGAVLNETARQILKDQFVIWLKVSVDQALARVGDGRTRPLLASNPPDSLAHLRQEREPIYRQVADVNVETDGRQIEQIVDEIITFVEGNMKRVNVEAEHPYSVTIGHDAINVLGDVVGEANRAAIIYTRSVKKYVDQAADIINVPIVPIEVADQEGAKTAATLDSCWQSLAEAGLTRDDVVIGVGGGAVTDLAGFVAATYLRGVGYISVPTTVLGMVDAAVGGKTGIDLPQGKNLAGAFYEPKAVIADLDVLVGLNAREIRSGLAEILKAGLVRDQRIVDLVAAWPAHVCYTASEEFAEILTRAIAFKADVVTKDLRERTSTPGHIGRELLNYGHTLGHAIERYENYRMRHGEAVSLGMIFAAELAHSVCGLAAEIVTLHRELLAKVGLPTRYGIAAFAELRRLMSVDKKARGSRLRFIGLEDLGRPVLIETPDEDVLADCYRRLS